jgi:nitrite reductase (NADH) small subunit
MSERLWVRVTTTAGIPVREGRAVSIAGREIAIFNLGDRFVATGNRCPHQGGPLCDGLVSGTAVVCPLHGWKVDLVSGRVARPGANTDACVETFPVRVRDGVVSVGLSPVAEASDGEGAAA